MAEDKIVLLDTSVAIAALFSPSGGSSRVIMETSKQNGYSLAINDYILEELFDLFQRKFPHKHELKQDLFNLMATGDISMVPTPPSTHFRLYYKVIEKKDAPILASALEEVDFLLSLDKDFLNEDLRIYAKMRGLIILTPGEFINQYLR